MTSDAAAHSLSPPARASMAGNPALTAALAITAIAAATIAGAWFFQLVLGLVPCPLCLEQRYAYYLAVPLGALLAIAAARDAPRPVLLAGLAILTLAVLGNAVLGGYHAGVEWKFFQGPTDCTGPVGNLGSAGNLLARLDSVNSASRSALHRRRQWRSSGALCSSDAPPSTVMV